MGAVLYEYVIVHTKLPPSPVILQIELGGKTKWLPLSFGYHDVMLKNMEEYVWGWCIFELLSKLDREPFLRMLNQRHN